MTAVTRHVVVSLARNLLATGVAIGTERDRCLGSRGADRGRLGSSRD
ncbi:hypothetical protein [Glaciibacter flavus]